MHLSASLPVVNANCILPRGAYPTNVGITRTLDRARIALAQARALGLREEEVIGDFTGGVRGMTLGMILSRLDGDSDVQMIGTHYDPDGTPVPPLFPVIFSFEPVLQDKS